MGRALLCLAAMLSACGGPTASAATAGERCVDLQADAVGLAWSQTGQFLAVGTDDGSGAHAGRILDVSGDGVGNVVVEAEMLPTTVVSSVEGRLAWLSDTANGRQLTEDRPGGTGFTLLPDTITGLGWTAIGYALLEHPADGGSRVQILDVDRPGDPNPIFQTDLNVERLWITADPEYLLLTITHPDHRDAPTTFEVDGPEAQRHLEPPGADASGASMSTLRRWVVYHSAATSRMEAVTVEDVSKRVTLTDRAAVRGMVSDRGILAYVPAEPAGQVCLVDVGATLP
jgi:hypothetical protein